MADAASPTSNLNSLVNNLKLKLQAYPRSDPDDGLVSILENINGIANLDMYDVTVVTLLFTKHDYWEQLYNFVFCGETRSNSELFQKRLDAVFPYLVVFMVENFRNPGVLSTKIDGFFDGLAAEQINEMFGILILAPGRMSVHPTNPSAMKMAAVDSSINVLKNFNYIKYWPLVLERDSVFSHLWQQLAPSDMQSITSTTDALAFVNQFTFFRLSPISVVGYGQFHLGFDFFWSGDISDHNKKAMLLYLGSPSRIQRNRGEFERFVDWLGENDPGFLIALANEGPVFGNINTKEFDDIESVRHLVSARGHLRNVAVLAALRQNDYAAAVNAIENINAPLRTLGDALGPIMQTMFGDGEPGAIPRDVELSQDQIKLLLYVAAGLHFNISFFSLSRYTSGGTPAERVLLAFPSYKQALNVHNDYKSIQNPEIKKFTKAKLNILNALQKKVNQVLDSSENKNSEKITLMTSLLWHMHMINQVRNPEELVAAFKAAFEWMQVPRSGEDAYCVSVHDLSESHAGPRSHTSTTKYSAKALIDSGYWETNRPRELINSAGRDARQVSRHSDYLRIQYSPLNPGVIGDAFAWNQQNEADLRLAGLTLPVGYEPVVAGAAEDEVDTGAPQRVSAADAGEPEGPAAGAAAPNCAVSLASSFAHFSGVCIELQEMSGVAGGRPSACSPVPGAAGAGDGVS